MADSGNRTATLESSPSHNLLPTLKTSNSSHFKHSPSFIFPPTSFARDKIYITSLVLSSFLRQSISLAHLPHPPDVIILCPAPGSSSPPTVPDGWKAQFDDRYNAWFYVNLATGKSQWEHPQPPTAPPPGPPPSELPAYDQSGPANPSTLPTDDKKQMSSNNPYNPANANPAPAPSPSIDEDARLAAKLQAEEDARANSRGAGNSGPPGAASDYYSNPGQSQSNTPPYAAGPNPSQSASPMPEQKRSKGGFLSKLMGKSSSSSSRPQQQYGSLGMVNNLGMDILNRDMEGMEDHHRVDTINNHREEREEVWGRLVRLH
ncbi:hypothetical protein N7450_007225 [Penicillium hetheringtonii]|uniref:WW domain-containing protein n=1 Tax=Penicillium hetheringtonii TaxID=911720 RepID=A0AAD6DH91_9EURO|nr:hypothetical protein N7450_007225 [Penicillium hetheringtonii]